MSVFFFTEVRGDKADYGSFDAVFPFFYFFIFL